MSWKIRARNKLHVSGLQDGIEKLKHELESRGHLRKATQTASKSGDCPICCDEIEVPVTLLGCSHKACNECLKHMVMSSSHDNPIVCIIDQCNKPLYIDDIKKLSDDRTFVEIYETALHRFLERNTNKYRRCPRVGCFQILQVPATARNDEQERALGGTQVVYCDVCLMSYCLTCSDKNEKEFLAHFGKMCRELALEKEAEIIKHRKHLAELFNPKCPKCESVFSYFDNCCAVKCESCSCTFCGLCLSFYHAQSCTTHDHVLNCQDNPTKGSYFVNEEAVRGIWKARNVKKMNEYLKSISNAEIREAVRVQCSSMV